MRVSGFGSGTSSCGRPALKRCANRVQAPAAPPKPASRQLRAGAEAGTGPGPGSVRSGGRDQVRAKSRRPPAVCSCPAGAAPPPGGGAPQDTPSAGGASRAGLAGGRLLLGLRGAAVQTCVEATRSPLLQRRIRRAGWGTEGAEPGCGAARAPRCSRPPERHCLTVGGARRPPSLGS